MTWRVCSWTLVSILVGCGGARARTPPAFRRPGYESRQSLPAFEAQTRSISPENFTGEKGKGGHGDRGHRPQGAARSGPDLEGLALGADQGPEHLHGGRHRRPRRDPADLDDPAPLDKTRQFILRFYWDGETEPSVEVPMGDFFACGWGKYLPDQLAAGLRQSRAAPSIATGRCRSARSARSRWRTSTTRI